MVSKTCYARRLRRKAPNDIWHLDEVVVPVLTGNPGCGVLSIRTATSLDKIIQTRRNTKAAKHFC